QTLTDVSGNAGVLYQWLRCDTGASCNPIPGAIGVSYTVTADDVGHQLVVVETPSGGGAMAQSSPTAVVTPPPPTLIAAPSISGAPVVGRTLTEAHGTWSDSPTVYGVQWVDCDAAGNACTPIAGATGQTYVLLASDLGHTIRVFEVAANAGGTSTPVATSPTGVVSVPPVNTAAPSVSGQAVVGGILACTTGTWTGTQPIAYTYEWAGDGIPIAGAVSSTHKLAATDVAQAIGCTVTATNAAGSAPAQSDKLLVTAAPACFGLTGGGLAKCKAKTAYGRARARCGAISTKTSAGRARMAACAAKARLAYRRAVAAAKCTSIKGPAKRAACLARARKIKK
ncbi:MAG: hypothetical protein LC720_04550, partial [Actinobacteria bacterium]|nr:hypothetical protein [Actinomycetota bacterium]